MIPRKKVVFAHDGVTGQHTAKVSYYVTLHEPPYKDIMVAGPSKADIEDELYRQLTNGLFGELRKELGKLQSLTEELLCFQGNVMKRMDAEKAQQAQFNKIMEMTRGYEWVK